MTANMHIHPTSVLFYLPRIPQHSRARFTYQLCTMLFRLIAICAYTARIQCTRNQLSMPSVLVACCSGGRSTLCRRRRCAVVVPATARSVVQSSKDAGCARALGDASETGSICNHTHHHRPCAALPRMCVCVCVRAGMRANKHCKYDRVHSRACCTRPNWPPNAAAAAFGKLNRHSCVVCEQ